MSFWCVRRTFTGMVSERALFLLQRIFGKLPLNYPRLQQTLVLYGIVNAHMYIQAPWNVQASDSYPSVRHVLDTATTEWRPCSSNRVPIYHRRSFFILQDCKNEITLDTRFLFLFFPCTPQCMFWRLGDFFAISISPGWFVCSKHLLFLSFRSFSFFSLKEWCLA